MSASIVDPFCGTRLISLCSIAEVVVWQVHTKPWTGIAYIYSSYKMLLDTYLKEYNEFEAWVVVHNFCDFFLYASEMMVFRITLA